MRSPRPIKTRAWIYILIYIGVTLIVALSILAGGYYWFSIRGMRNDLDQAAKEMVTRRLLYEDEQIKFRLDDEGRTLSGFLRDENMSAEVLDKSNKVVARYGVFQNEAEIVGYVRDNRETRYSEFVGKSGEKYLTLSLPILYQGEKVGQLILALPMLIFGHFLEVGLWLLATVLVLSMLLSWPLSHQLVGIVFRSLDEVVQSMSKVGIDSLGDKIEYQGNDNDEIGILVKTYNQLLERLNEGMLKQKSFVSNASHELKTPLARLVSSLEVMRIDMEDKSTRIRIDKMKVELMDLSRKVDSLLLLSRYDRDDVKLQKNIFSPVDIIKKVVDGLETKVEIMKTKVTICDNWKETIETDKVGFELVVTNLISNAVKYNKVGGEVKVSVEKLASNKLAIEVTDQGEGIDRKDLEKIFERFNRGEKHQFAIPGFGVGMSLAKQICERNSWTIDYDKEFKPGTRVVFTIAV